MPWKYPADQVEYVAVAYPGTGNLWAWASDGSRCVHLRSERTS